MPKENIFRKTRTNGDARNLGKTPQKRSTVLSHAFLALSDIYNYIDTDEISYTLHQDFNNVKVKKLKVYKISWSFNMY